MEKKQQEDIDDWYKVMLYRLIDVCKIVSSKYTRAKVRKALPADYGYIIEELITEKPEVLDKEAYYEAIIQTILEIGSAENFIIAVAELIQRLVVDHLHIIGDIFDRGPEPYKIMDCLMNYHSLDIQWGNHDVRCDRPAGVRGQHDPHLPPLRQSRCAGGRLRHQYASACHLCSRDVRR